MKKIFCFCAVLFLTIGCSNKGETNVSNESTPGSDTASVVDSSSLNQVSDTITEATAPESTAPANVADEKKDAEKEKETKEAKEEKKPSPNAKKIDKDLKWFEHDVKQYVQAIKYGMMGYELSELRSPCVKNEKNLKKYEKEMTPDQLAKFKKYQKMLKKY